MKNKSSAKTRLCITSPWNYPLFNPDNKSHFGGWEVRIALIAKELAKRQNIDVSLVVGDHGQPHVETKDQVKLYSWIGRVIWGIPIQTQADGTVKKKDFLQKILKKVGSLIDPPQPLVRATKIGPYDILPEALSVYDEVNADVYMVPGNSQFSGEVAYYCKERRKKYIFLAGSDMDYYPEYKANINGNDIYSVPHALKLFAIEQADAHIVQNERQAEMLKTGYGRNGIVIKNPMDLGQKFLKNPNGCQILWVGKSDERVKRPGAILELARRLPQFSFTLIMNSGVPETHQLSLAEAKSLPNVTLIERVPFEEIESYFANAHVFVNTSTFEGFPNTFLQAGKYGVPVASLKVDPGGMISQHGCGLLADDQIDRLSQDVSQLMTNQALYTEKSSHILSYVKTYHDKEIIIPKFEDVIQTVSKIGKIF